MLCGQVMDTTLAESVVHEHEDHVSSISHSNNITIGSFNCCSHSDATGKDFFTKNEQLKRPMSPHMTIYRWVWSRSHDAYNV